MRLSVPGNWEQVGGNSGTVTYAPDGGYSAIKAPRLHARHPGWRRAEQRRQSAAADRPAAARVCPEATPTSAARGLFAHDDRRPSGSDDDAQQRVGCDSGEAGSRQRVDRAAARRQRPLPDRRGAANEAQHLPDHVRPGTTVGAACRPLSLTPYLVPTCASAAGPRSRPETSPGW